MIIFDIKSKDFDCVDISNLPQGNPFVVISANGNENDLELITKAIKCINEYGDLYDE